MVEEKNMITLIDKSEPWMRRRIMQDAYKLAKEKQEQWGSTPILTTNDFNFALSIIACRYSSMQWRVKATEIMEERLGGR